MSVWVSLDRTVVSSTKQNNADHHGMSPGIGSLTGTFEVSFSDAGSTRKREASQLGYATARSPLAPLCIWVDARQCCSPKAVRDGRNQETGDDPTDAII